MKDFKAIRAYIDNYEGNFNDELFKYLYDEFTTAIKEESLYANGGLITLAREDSVKLLIQISCLKSAETIDHMTRVGRHAARLGSLFGLKDDDIKVLNIAGQLHDIGKIIVSSEILHKKGRYTKMDFSIMQKHPFFGYSMLSNSGCSILKKVAVAILDHHEKYNGLGYPNSKKGKEICKIGHIVSLVDTFDALATRRSYKEPWSRDKIKKHLTSLRGTSFSPALVDMFLCNMDDFYENIKEAKKAS